MLDIKTMRTNDKNTVLDELKKMRKELKETSIAVLNRKVKDVGKPRRIRKDIAKALTVLREKQILETGGN